MRSGAGDMAGGARWPSTSQASTRAALARPWALASFASAAASSVCTTAGHKQSVSQQDKLKQPSHASATPAATKGRSVSQPSCPLAIP